MSWSISFLRAADNEYVKAAQWHEDQRAGYGGRLIDAVEATILAIKDDPHRVAVEHEDVRVAPVIKFSYCIYDRIVADRIRIVSVFHTSRDPQIWQRRVS